VKSLREIIDHGLHHEALDATFRLRDTISTRDSDAYAKALGKQQILRQRLVALLDSLRLDALVYPTMQRRPAIVGEPQAGTTCSLSSNSGLPALSLPAGFTGEGLPVALELLGRPFSDTRLVALAYAFEQSGVRRRPPATTPALRDARAPATVAYAAGAGSASASLTFDITRSELRYEVRVNSAAVLRSQGVVLRRVDPADASGGPARRRVIQRLAGPAMRLARGTIPLADADRRALLEGRLWVMHTTTDSPLGNEGQVKRMQKALDRD
jgi:hypothetical protein